MILVPTLISKLKQAKELLQSSEQAYQKLTSSLSKADLELWSNGERQAQEKREKDVRSMDYFALKTNTGEV